jgi:hypothetical protein
VFLTGTSEGSPSRDVFGETIPPQGLQIIRVFGQTFSGKNECVAITKTQPEQLGVKMEYLAPGMTPSSTSEAHLHVASGSSARPTSTSTSATSPTRVGPTPVQTASGTRRPAGAAAASPNRTATTNPTYAHIGSTRRPVSDGAATTMYLPPAPSAHHNPHASVPDRSALIATLRERGVHLYVAGLESKTTPQLAQLVATTESSGDEFA